MPQTPPFHALTPPRKLTDAELAIAIRLNLEAELDAINLYSAHIEATDNEEAKSIIRHVMNEEKEHAALFQALIKRLDPSYAQHDAEAGAKFKLIISGASDEEVEAVGREAEESEARVNASAIEPPLPKTLTVGSLFKR